MTIDLITMLTYDKFISDFNLSFSSQLPASAANKSATIQEFVENKKPLQENLQNLPENMQIPVKNDQLKDVLDSVSNYCNNKLISQISFIQILNKEKIQFKLNKSDEIEFNLPNCEPLIIKRFLFSFNEQQNQWEVIIQEEKSILKDIEITNDENNSQVTYHKDLLLWKIQNKNLSFNELEVILRILKGICRTVELAIKWKKIKEQAATDLEYQFLVSKFSLFKFKLFTVVFEYTLDKIPIPVDLTGPNDDPIMEDQDIHMNKHYLTIQCSLNYSITCSSEQSLFKRAIDANINLTRDLKSILQIIWRTTKPLQVIQSQFSVSSRVLPTDFIFIPHSATRLRVVYRSRLALDIRFIHDDRISLDDGSSSLFSTDRSDHSIKPIHGLDEILGEGAKLISHDDLELSLRSIHNLMGSLSLQYDIIKFIQDNYKTIVPDIIAEKKKPLAFKVRLPAIGNAPQPVVTFQITAQNYEYLEINATLSDASLVNILNEFLKQITGPPFRSENVKIFLSILFTAPIQKFIPLFKSHLAVGTSYETKVSLCLNNEKGYIVDKLQNVSRFTLRCTCQSNIIDFPITYDYAKDVVRKLNGDNNTLGKIVSWLESLTLDALIDARKAYKEDEPRKLH